MKVKRKIIEINDELCDGCGQCVPACAEGAIKIIDGKARLVSDVYCDGLGACLGECPNGALEIIERDAEEFDEEAVEEYLSSMEDEPPEEEVMACGCPSTKIQEFVPAQSCDEANIPSSHESDISALTHWPIQIRLVPPSAPFLKNADLLVAADCTAVAYPNLHRDFIKGRTVLMGCPKFDNAEEYIDKFIEIFKRADIKSITILIMDVPCCSGLPAIVEKGMKLAGKEIPVERVVIDARGNILSRENLAV